jgi:hypothetical protein
LLTKAGRFGITVQAGPPHPLIQSTIQELFFAVGATTAKSNSNSIARTAAIIYMFVEPAFRGCNLGALALQVIRFLHASVADCDYTLLVADDKTLASASAASAATSSSSSAAAASSSQQQQQEHRLVAWYEREGGFVRAPALQELMGSPNQVHGISMIGPTTFTTSTTQPMKAPQDEDEDEAALAATSSYPTFVPLPEDCTIEWYYDPEILVAS